MCKTMCKTIENKDKSEKPIMNYIAVAKHEIKSVNEEYIPDGWVKMTREKNGEIRKKWGKEVINHTISRIEHTDKIQNYLKMQQRHLEYKVRDNENYYTDYKYSWESENDSEFHESDGEEESDDNESDCDLESDADY